MDATLRAKHMETLTSPEVIDFYDRLCAVCEAREGGLTPVDQALIADAAYMEQIKRELLQDVRTRGIGKERTNGRQHYWEENKSLAQARAYIEQQRKILSELRVTPASRKAASVVLGDGFDEL